MLNFKISDKNSKELFKKNFEFEPNSRKDHFKFIMKGVKVNEKVHIFDIGSKVFPLEDINSQEEY